MRNRYRRCMVVPVVPLRNDGYVCRFERSCVPHRRVGDQLVLAHPSSRTALVLGPTACLVWSALDSSPTFDQLIQALAVSYPDVIEGDLVAVLDEILALLLHAGLVEALS